MVSSALRFSAWLPLGLALLLAAGACTQPPGSDPANSPPSGSTGDSAEPSPEAADPGAPADPIADTESLLALTGDGLQLVGNQTGSTVALNFGTEMGLVADAVTSILGGPLESVENSECGAGPQQITQWPRGLVLHAANGDFIGWSLGPNADRTLTTMAGVGVGSTRSDLEGGYAVEVFESSLGTEFAAGNLFGILSSAEADATIENLWAGTTCNFR